jgi:hypothetical protein
MNLGSVLIKFYVMDYKLIIWGKNIWKKYYMVSAQENKIYFRSSRLRLPHDVGEVEYIAAFCHINRMNLNMTSGNERTHFTLKF